MAWSQVCYCYDGSFAGFLTCVYESYLRREAPALFSAPDDPRISLFPQRRVESSQEHAGRVYRSLAARISPLAQSLVRRGFLTCLEERELHLWRFIRLGYQLGPAVVAHLTDPRVAVVNQAVHHLLREAHLYKGFLRFSQLEGVLLGEIEPKNQVLPLLRPHFCARFPAERFVIHDRTHRQALFHQPGAWRILPVDAFQMGAPEEAELACRQLWRRFYHTIAIEGRYNPDLRRSNMPKRYWGQMTEFQQDSPTLPEQKNGPR